jgi:hypothetical protein
MERGETNGKKYSPLAKIFDGPMFRLGTTGNDDDCVKCRIFAAVKVWIEVVAPCCLVGVYQRVGETFPLSTALKMETTCSSETCIATRHYNSDHNPDIRMFQHLQGKIHFSNCYTIGLNPE